MSRTAARGLPWPRRPVGAAGRAISAGALATAVLLAAPVARAESDTTDHPPTSVETPSTRSVTPSVASAISSAASSSVSSAASSSVSSAVLPSVSSLAGTLPSAASWTTLRIGMSGTRVRAAQRALVAHGIPLRGGVDGSFGAYTKAAVTMFQQRASLVVTGTVNVDTALRLGLVADTPTAPPPPPTDPAPEETKSCPSSAHAAVLDRARQRAWLCDHGRPLAEFVVTSAQDQPDPGTYHVYSKSVSSYSRSSGSYTTMTYFTAFARGEQRGARVGFHSVPKYRNGAYIQPLSSVGSMAMFGKTAGCVRVLPNQAVTIYRWLAVGDAVVVIS